MIKLNNVCYHEKKFSLQNINFEVEEGYIMTLLGKNGAGKTTLLDVIFGNLKANEGQVLWNDMDVTGAKALEAKIQEQYYREQVGYVGDKTWMMGGVSLEENITLFSSLYAQWKKEIFDEILERLEFSKDKLQETYESLSTGEKIQLQLAFQLAKQPKLLLLDEPMANLDPVIKTDVWDILSHYCREEEMSIIISTHLVEEVNDITDYIGVLKAGQMVCFGAKDDLLETHQCEDLRELIRRVG